MRDNLPPIVLQMKLSPEQTRAITPEGVDVVVTAGAGTGKTTTLVARYLTILARDDTPIRSIVAITFTDKAAREMRNRVRRQISRHLANNDQGDGEREKWEERLAQIDGARIGTIHSLCAEILRSNPVEAEVDPDFDILDEGLAATLRARAAEETMSWAADRHGNDPATDVASLYAWASGGWKAWYPRCSPAALRAVRPSQR